jgi:acid phosphatase class B
MVRSRSLPIAFTGEKEKPKQNDKKKNKKKTKKTTFHSVPCALVI